MKRRKQSDGTVLVVSLVCGVILLWLSAAGVVAFVGYHFISKFLSKFW